MSIPKPFSHELYEPEVLDIDLDRVRYILSHHFRFIAEVTLLLAGLACAAILFFYQEQYRSEATLFLDVNTNPGIIATNTATAMVKGLDSVTDPFKSQVELLRSKTLAQKVFETLVAEKKVRGVKSLSDIFPKVMEAEHVGGTNFVKLTVRWPNPKEAQVIAETYMQSYQDLAEAVELTPLKERKVILQKELAVSENTLNDINNSLQLYQEQNNIVDIGAEGNLMLGRLGELQQDYEKLEATLAEKRAESAKIQRQLHLDPQTAIQSVARGQDGIYANLTAQLTEAEQEYNTKTLVLSPTNPKMRQLQEKIAVLKRQLENQELQTIGRRLKMKNIIIMDEVRRELVKRLAVIEAEISALIDKQKVSKRQIEVMEASLGKLPEKQANYAHLLLEQKNWTDIVNRLRENLAETQIQERYKKLFVFSPPNLPERAIFPSKMSLIMLACLASCILPTGIIVGWQYRHMDTIADPYFLEAQLNIPVLSRVPVHYKHMNYDLVTQAFQDLAITLKSQLPDGKKALAFAAVYTENRRRSTTLVNLAYNLAQTGDRVLLVEADLRQPKLGTTLEKISGAGQGLTTLVTQLDNLMRQTQSIRRTDWLQMAQPHILPTDIHANVFYMPAGEKTNQPFPLLNAPGFKALMSLLKDNYDWVLLDAPCLLANAETYALLRATDGLVVCLERTATKHHTRLVQHKVNQIHGSIVGAVVRDLPY